MDDDVPRMGDAVTRTGRQTEMSAAHYFIYAGLLRLQTAVLRRRRARARARAQDVRARTHAKMHARTSTHARQAHAVDSDGMGSIPPAPTALKRAHVALRRAV